VKVLYATGGNEARWRRRVKKRGFIALQTVEFKLADLVEVGRRVLSPLSSSLTCRNTSAQRRSVERTHLSRSAGHRAPLPLRYWPLRASCGAAWPRVCLSLIRNTPRGGTEESTWAMVVMSANRLCLRGSAGHRAPLPLRYWPLRASCGAAWPVRRYCDK
jgi:hypothetical protein